MITNKLSQYLITLALLVLILYGLFVFRHVFHKPEIFLEQDTFIETTEPTIVISGRVDNIQNLLINTKPLLFEQSGSFSQTRTLEEGISMLTLTGTDKFGRSTSVTITVNKSPTQK